MKKTQVIFTLALIILALSAAIFGVLEETKFTGKINSFAYTIYVITSLMIFAGLVSKLFFIKKRFVTAFIKSSLFSYVTFIVLEVLGKTHYHGIKVGLEYFVISTIGLIFNLELIVYLSIIYFILLILHGLIHLIGKVDFKK